jgi:hypothetical protein
MSYLAHDLLSEVKKFGDPWLRHINMLNVCVCVCVCVTQQQYTFPHLKLLQRKLIDQGNHPDNYSDVWNVN